MAIFDTITKSQVQTHPMDFVNYCLDFEQNDVTFVELVTPEQPTIEMHQADILIKVQINDQAVLVHIEFQTTDSHDPEMSLRMAGYIIRLIETYRMPVYSSVIYLRPDAGRRDLGHYEQRITGHQVYVEYQVFRLIEMDGQQILDTKSVGLIPFTPLMRRPADMDAEQWLRHCIQVADSIEVPDKPAYLAGMAVLGNLVYEHHLILDIISEVTMHESTLVQYLTEEAHQQGVKTRALEDILEVLELRLQPDSARIFKPELETIDDLDRLKQLHRAAVLAETPEDFRKALESNGR
jgi:hypothetical protein